MASRARRGPTWFLLPVLGVLPTPGAAQEPPSALRGPELLARLRAPNLTLAEATTLAPQLLAQPVPLRLSGCDALREQFLVRQKRHAKSCQDLAKAVAKAVAARPDRATGKRGADPAEAARSGALAVSRRDGLTKEMIHQEIDPLVEQLEGLLWPQRDRVLAADADLATAFASLQEERGELQPWFTVYGESTSGLELHPDAQKHFAKVPPPDAPPPVAGLDDEWTVWTLLALPLSARDRRTLETNEELRAAVAPEEFAGTTALNRLRWLLGLSLLRIDEKLTRAARDHSSDMEKLGFFDHTSPVAGKRTPGDRAARFGSSAGAENIAAGHDTGAGAIRAWWYSPGHHRNMLGNHARVGLGRSGQLWTQMFGG